MANVQLPSINQNEPDTDKLVKQLLNVYIMLTEELTFLLNNLDTRNVNELNAEVVVAGSIVADKIAAGAITAEKIDVDELSAISANLGHITAGLIDAVQIFGSYIATSRDYPKAEMSILDNLFAAALNARNYIQIQADYGGAPSINFITGGAFQARIDTLMGYLEIISLSALDIIAMGGINISPGNTSNLRIPPFDRVVSADNQNLGQELRSRAYVEDSGYNLAFDETTRNLKMFSRNSDLLAIVNIPR